MEGKEPGVILPYTVNFHEKAPFGTLNCHDEKSKLDVMTK